MTCEEAHDALSSALDGESAPGDRAALDVHLVACADCRALAAALRLQDAELRRAFAPRRKAAAEVAARALEQIAAGAGGSAGRPGRSGEGRSLRGSWLRTWGLAACGAAAGFLGALVVFPPTRPGAPAPAVVELPTTAPVSQGPAPAVPDASLPGGTAPSLAIAQLTIALGHVEIDEGHGWRPLPLNGSVPEGGRVRTGGEASCELRAVDGSELRLAGDTVVVFRGGRRLDLEGGRLWSSVMPGSDLFSVAVAGATITALGTQFEVARGASSTVLTMVEGMTRVEAAGSLEYVPQGWVAKITSDGIEKERANDVLRATAWVNRLLSQKAPGHPELSKRLQSLLAEIGNSKMRFLAEEELVELGESCVRPLLSYLLIEGPEGASAARRELAARVACKLATERHIYDLIQLLADGSRDVRVHAATALKRLTGEAQGVEPETWGSRSFSDNEAAFRRWLAWWEAKRAAGEGKKA